MLDDKAHNNGTKVVGYKEVTEEQKKEAKQQMKKLKSLKPMPQEVKNKIKERALNYQKEIEKEKKAKAVSKCHIDK